MNPIRALSYVLIAFFAVACGSSNDVNRNFSQSILVRGESHCQEVQQTLSHLLRRHIALTDQDGPRLVRSALQQMLAEDDEINEIYPARDFDRLLSDFESEAREYQGGSLQEDCLEIRRIAQYRAIRIEQGLNSRFDLERSVFAAVQSVYRNYEEDGVPGVLVYSFYQFLRALGGELDRFSGYRPPRHSPDSKGFGIRTEIPLFLYYQVEQPLQFGGLRILGASRDDGVNPPSADLFVGDVIRRANFAGPSEQQSFDLTGRVSRDRWNALDEAFNNSDFDTVDLEIEREGVSHHIRRQSQSNRLRRVNPSVEVELREGLLYARIFEFSEGVSLELSEKLNAARRTGESIKGIILDLRSNPGGWTNEAQRIAGLFLPNILIGYQLGKDFSQQSQDLGFFPMLSESFAVTNEEPMLVLIDHRSASSSEILAEALQSTGRALVLGERSFGKYISQQILQYGGVGKLRGSFYITVAQFFNAHGRSRANTGLEPSFGIEFVSRREASLRAACRGEACPPRRLENLESDSSGEFSVLPLVNRVDSRRLPPSPVSEELPLRLSNGISLETLQETKIESSNLDADELRAWAHRILLKNSTSPSMAPLPAPENEEDADRVVRRVPQGR